MASEEDSFFDEKEYKDWEPIFEREDATIKRKYEESGFLAFFVFLLCCVVWFWVFDFLLFNLYFGFFVVIHLF